MSSSVILSFNPAPCQNSLTTPPNSQNNLFNSPNSFKFPSLPLFKSHICFTINNNSSNHDIELVRWLREDQRWLREEHRWLRLESRWEAERESLLNEIEAVKFQMEELGRQGVSISVLNAVNLLQVLKKDVSQIAESGSSAEEVVVRVSEDEKKRITLRVGSEGDEVRVLQEALQTLGFYPGEDIEFASFSSGTELAVRTWQVSNSLPFGAATHFLKYEGTAVNAISSWPPQVFLKLE